MYIFLDVIERFSCRMCGNCCRNDWLVTVDESSYLRNAEWFAASGGQEEFRQAFIPLNENKGLGEYAYIAKKTDGGCWFLTDGHLCRLHRQAGHDHLDNVCQTYPRYPMNTARGYELTLSFSCPAVLDLVSRVKSLNYVRSDRLPISLNGGNEVVDVFPSQQPLNTPLRYYFELEHHFIDILQHRALSLEERLALLDGTVRALNNSSKAEDFGERLNEIINGNYNLMGYPVLYPDDENITPAILAEHFLVNLIFKKVFYIYGLPAGTRLLTTVWHKIESACRRAEAGNLLSAAKAEIMALELRYSHNKKELIGRTNLESK